MESARGRNYRAVIFLSILLDISENSGCKYYGTLINRFEVADFKYFRLNKNITGTGTNIAS